MFDELYSQGTSCLHRADPRFKLAGVTLLVVLIALSRHWETAAAGLALGLILMTIARLPFLIVAKRIFAVNGFILFLVLILPLTTPGQSIWSISGIHLTREGFILGGLIALKSNAILLLFFALVTTSNVASIGRALQKLGFPAKLTYLLLFCYRYLFVIHQEYQRLRRAARLRCFRPSTRLHAYSTFGNLLGMTLIRSFDRAERVNLSMQMRGFRGKFYSLGQFTARPSDWGLLLTLLTVTACFAYFELTTGLS